MTETLQQRVGKILGYELCNVSPRIDLSAVKLKDIPENKWGELVYGWVLAIARWDRISLLSISALEACGVIKHD